MDRLTLDIFHDDIGLTLIAGTTAEQKGNVGMVEVGQDLAFGGETPPGVLTQGPADQLDGDPLIEALAFALGQKDHSHAAFAKLVDDAEAANLSTNHGVAVSVIRETGIEVLSELHRGSLVGGQSVQGLRAQVRVVTFGFDESRTLLRGQFQRALDQVFDDGSRIGRGHWISEWLAYRSSSSTGYEH